MGTSPLLGRIRELAAGSQGARVALEDERHAMTFSELVSGAERVARALLARAGRESLSGQRVCLLAAPEAAWVEAFFGVLLAGGVAVPLSPLYPPRELAWFVGHAGAKVALASAEGSGLLRQAREAEGAPDFEVTELGELGARADGASPLPRVGAEDGAVVLYTSGTTGKPKGALISHRAVATQARLLGEAWGHGPEDLLLHALPLHHLHGLGISLLTCLLSGASARLLPRFDARRVWEALAEGGPTVLMAVPTMYQKLFEAFDAADEASRARFARGAKLLRLATSGSAALPVTLAERWRALTGSIPLERFGMTEIGVGLSNPLEPSRRRAGSVGLPLPTVETRIVGDDGLPTERGPGELWVRGPSLFSGYLDDPAATEAAFSEGFFRTGDRAEQHEDGYVRLLGRTSVDILKSGGYKISALEVEEALREHEAVLEVAVVGLPDETWGDRVVAAVVLRPGLACDPDALRAFAKERLAAYKVPKDVFLLDSLPRNALGKVVKPELSRALLAPRG